jgi:hypothetical protein
MSSITNNPDGAPLDKNDGGIYANGHRVCVRPKRSETGGISLGGTIAEAQNEDTATEIARRCEAFPLMIDALRTIAAGDFNCSPRQHGMAMQGLAERVIAQVEAL